MSRPSKHVPIQCRYYRWRLRERNGVFYADGRINNPPLKKYSLGTRDKGEARRRLDELDVQVAIERGIAPPSTASIDASNLTIEKGWQLFISHCEAPEILGGVSKSTIKRYRAVRDKHLRYCATHNITSWSQINKKTTIDYGRWLERERILADRTIVLECNLVCGIVKWLVEEGTLPPQHRFVLKLAKPEGTTTYCFTKAQVARMIEYCAGISKLTWLGNVITALATTGFRINELVKLRWTDIDLDSDSIRLTDERARPRRRQSGFERRLKGRRGRVVPLNPSLRQLLLRLPRQRDGLVFHDRKGNRIVDRRVLAALQGKVIMALLGEFPTVDGETGFKDGTVHGLRHYFVSEAYRNGATDAELAEWLGHRDSQLLRIYRHLRPEDGQAKMQSIDFLGDPSEPQQPRNSA